MTFVSSGMPVRRWLTSSAVALVALGIVTAGVLHWRGLSGIPVYYFYAQDSILLLVAAAALLIMACKLDVNSTGSTKPFVLSRMGVAAAIGSASLFAYAGTWLIMLRYPMSRDEALAEFASDYIRNGQLGLPVPPGMRDISLALMPVWSERRLASGNWVSNYQPVNSALRALAALIGDGWLAGPALLAVGMFALWSSARRIWPHTSEPASVALILAVTSSQILVTAMTPYAMTAHFALNSLWLSCFLRGGRLGHGSALVIGLLASGLHQFHFHIMFLSGFIIWSWLSGRRGIALLYVAACLFYHAFWQIGYEHLMIARFGQEDARLDKTIIKSSWITENLSRLRDLEPFSSFSRFTAWQNVLTLPLAVRGLVTLRRRDGVLPIAVALQISCCFGLATMVYQGFGYGYRYLHGLLPCFLLLAAGGSMRLRELRKCFDLRRIILAASGVSLCIILPFTLWTSHDLLKPYAAAYHAARAAPADIVLVDGRGGGFLQDIVRINGPVTPPLLLDLAYVPPRTLRRLCATRRVLLFDAHQAQSLGIMGSGAGDKPQYRHLAANNRREIARWHCDRPVPLSPL